MKLLANENFPYKSIYCLKERGYDILSIGMDNPGIMDSEVMAIAISEERTILTFDKNQGKKFPHVCSCCYTPKLTNFSLIVLIP